MKIYKTKSTKETRKIAAGLVKKLLKKRTKRKNALIFALTGDLGSGKTTFVQGFLRGLGVRKKITSPTFVLFKKYQIPSSAFCPECNQLQHLAWRNERSIYKRKCDKSGAEILSIYSPDKAYTVYGQKEWYKDD